MLCRVVPFVVWCLAVAPYPVAGPEPGVHHKPPPKSNPQAVTLGGKVVEDTAALKEGLAVEATAEKAAEAAAAAAKAEQAEGARQAEEVKAALGNLLSGSEGEGTPLLGPDGKPLLGPDGKPLLGPGKPLLGPDGKPLLGPDGKPLLGPGGTPLLGPDGKPLLGPDGKPLLGPGGTDLGRLSSLPPVSDFKSQVLLSAVVSLLLAPTAWCIFVSE
ncbi:MAG: hypothetical protein KVP17_002509 [Porospora cf. gigantea B]|uniref:uncharacterized protein n=1 Tax=Porospora cf. gigantea B TaxID=2853592 RepID=UPI003571D82B|nr:MAG: hypothetical protein KVP17_002509 [Porospora cf. gigantea B]